MHHKQTGWALQLSKCWGNEFKKLGIGIIGRALHVSRMKDTCFI